MASFASSYIPTAAAAVTRNADVLTYPTSGNVVGTAGTAFAEVTFPVNTTDNEYILDLSVVARPALYYRRPASLSIYDGTTESADTAITPSQTTIQKVASIWGTSAMKTFLAGTPGSGAAFDGNMNVGADMTVGNGAGASSPLYGTVKNAKIFATALSDVEVAAL